MKGKKKLLSTLIVSLIAALLIFIPAMATPQNAEAATIAPQVMKHTRDEIRKYYYNNKIDFNAPVTYKIQPQKYSTVGSLSDSTNRTAMANLNYIRYIVGISSDVMLNTDLSVDAQYSAFVNDLNGYIHHYPVQPSGVSASIYKKGYDASSMCSLSGWNNVNYALIRWMHELYNSSEQYPLGHRMHIIDPTLSKTGFGVSNTYGGCSTMYTGLGSRNYNNNNEKYVIWPAQQTPIDVWAGATKWSVSSIGSSVDIKKVKVKITHKDNGRVWNISNNNTANGTIFTQSFGSNIYLMFEPKDLNPVVGDKYDVEITNLGSDTLKYAVEFFNIKTKPEFVKENGVWVIKEDGRIRTDINGLIQNPEDNKKWTYFENGIQNKKYVGTSPSTANKNGRYFVKNGVFDESYTGLAQYKKSAGGDDKWYYVENGRHKSYTGVCKSTNEKLYYATKGVWDTSYTGLAKYEKRAGGDDKLYYIGKGRFETVYTGLAQFKKSAGGDDIWYYVKDSKQEVYTGICKSTNGKLYYVKNGVWDTSYTGLAQYKKSTYGDDNWYYVKDGRPGSYTGICRSTNGKLYYAKNGIWDTSYTGLAQYKSSTYGDDNWYYVKDGRPGSYTGICKSTNGNIYYAKDGKFDTSYTGLAQYKKSTYGDDVWYYVTNGRYDTKFVGLSSSTANSNKIYYVKSGSWQNKYTGKITFNGKLYNIKNGKVV